MTTSNAYVLVLASLALVVAATDGCAPEAPAAARAPMPAPAAPSPSAPLAEPALAAGVDVAYTVELVNAPFPHLAVTLVARGTAKGETLLTLYRWADVDHPESELHGLSACDDAGHALAIDHESVWTSKAHDPTWTVHHAPGATLHVAYDLVSTQLDVGFGSSSYYRPLLQPSFFHLIGATALVQPDSVPRDKPARVAFHWRGFKQAGWNVACSFSVAQDDFEATETLDDFRHAVFLGGQMRLVRRDIGPSRSPLWVAIVGNEWGFTDDAFADLSAAVVGAQRAFFHDDDWPFFLISVIPVAGDARGSSWTQGGTGLTHSFALFLSPHTDAAVDAKGDGVPRLLAHELFHTWNGLRYELSDPEPLGYWFSEGFTDFYARRLSYRVGVTDRRAYVAGLNDTIRRYLASPVRSAPAARIAADFWKDRAVEKLPYLRGDLVAFLVDAEIRKDSHGDKSLDDLMRGMLADRPRAARRVDTDYFLQAIARLTSPGFAAQIRKVVVDGAVVTLDPKLLEPCLHGKVEAVPAYDAGLDMSALTTSHRITGVVPGSTAYRAGLRSGQRVRGYDLGDDPARPVEITVQDGDVERVIRYLPVGKPVPTLTFSAGEPLDASCGKVL